METTKTSNFTCESKSFISTFFTCHVSARKLQPFSCYDLANDIYSQTAKTVFSHLNLTWLFQRDEMQVNKYKFGKLFTKAEVFPGESILRFIHQSQHQKNYLRHGINIITNQRLSPTFRGNGNTINDGDSQSSLLPIFSDRGGTSVHRLRRKEVKSVEIFWQFRSTAQKCSFNDGPFRFVIIGKNYVGI